MNEVGDPQAHVHIDEDGRPVAIISISDDRPTVQMAGARAILAEQLDSGRTLFLLDLTSLQAIDATILGHIVGSDADLRKRTAGSSRQYSLAVAASGQVPSGPLFRSVSEALHALRSDDSDGGLLGPVKPETPRPQSPLGGQGTLEEESDET